MRFYEIRAEVKSIDFLFKGDYEDVNEYVRYTAFHSKVNGITERLNRELGGKAFLSASIISSEEVTACLLLQDRVEFDIDAEIRAYFDKLGIRIKKLNSKESTFETFKYLLARADRNDFIDDDDDTLEDLGLGTLSRRRHYFSAINYSEDVFELSTKKANSKRCNRLLTSNDLKDEIDRITTPKTQLSVQGHPVHYLILSDDEEVQKETQSLLLNSLIKEQRLESRRICEASFPKSHEISPSHTEGLFSMCHEGAISIKLDNIQDLEGDRMSSSLESLEILCECIKKHRNDVLVILQLPKECTQLKNFLFENLGNLSFVEINEKPAEPKRARQLLRAMAKDKELEADESLFSKIEVNETYLATELRTMFDEWFSKKLRTEVYPQYAQFKMAKTDEAAKEAKGSAYDDLMKMIGLGEAKKIINQAIDFHKMQRFLANQDITRERPAQHMIFTGNPGTAKTTVARLFARIMRDNELLSSGHIVEVGRGDLVGKYVGHTAPLVKSVFARARGGVLFIDEAYSLVDDRDGCFGDEAINTIVQEMENMRDSVIVIFAGYPDKMEQFLQKNPGLRSRIAFHVPFADYTAAELGKIAQLIASEKGMKLTEDAQEKLVGIFESSREEEDFGNGRFVRSAVEKAMMAQASRVVKENLEALTKTELTTIVAEDIETPTSTKPKRLKLGFCA